MKRALLLGGTGPMGAHVSLFLSDLGYQVYVTTRTIRKSDLKINYIQGNAKEIPFLCSLMKDKWDVIIDFMSYTTREFIERAETLLNSTKQYIFISSARVYSDTGEKPINENSLLLLNTTKDEQYLNTDEYALSKARQEMILMNTEYKNWTIVRPSLTYGQYRLQLGVYEKENWLYRALHGRTIVFSEDLVDKYVTLTYGKDVAQCICQLVDKEESLRNVYNVVGQETMLWDDVLKVYCDVLEKYLNKKIKVTYIKKSTNLMIESEKYQVLYGRYFCRRFDNSKINEFVNTDMWIKPMQGLAMCLEEFLKDPTFNAIDWRVEALIDRAAKEWTKLSEINNYKDVLKYLIYRLGMGNIFDIYINIKQRKLRK